MRFNKWLEWKSIRDDSGVMERENQGMKTIRERMLVLRVFHFLVYCEQEMKGTEL